jgi:hypothetical protein
MKRDDQAAARLDSYIARYTPEVAGVAREALDRMRAYLPGAVQLAYDNYNALAIGFGPTERTADAVFSIALFPHWVSLFLLKGAGLPDPHKLLKGKGKVARHLVLEDAAMLDLPAVQALLAAAVKRAPVPFDAAEPGRIIIKSVSAKQRPRRPAP